MVRILTFIFTLCMFFSNNSNAEDVVESCGNCSYSQARSIALRSSVSNDEKIHIVDFKNGTVKSFEVIHEYEDDFHFQRAHSIYTPVDIQTAATEVSRIISDTVSSGGSYNDLSNILTKKITIPSHIATSSSQLRDIVTNQAVANHLRLRLAANLAQQLRRGWEKIFQKLTLKVEVKFIDDSTATYSLGYIYFSRDPFLLDKNSLKDSNGNNISLNSGGAGSSRGNYISYGSTYSNGSFGGVRLKCQNYTVTDSQGGYTRGRTCIYLPSQT